MSEIYPSSSSEESEYEETETIIECEFFKESETHATYIPRKVKIGKPGLTNLDEGCALSCVAPPDVTYKLSIDPDRYNKPIPDFSRPQLEAITYACQAHEKFITETGARLGFLLGDGTGTGKTRVLAGIILEYSLKSVNRTLWVTANQQLFRNAQKEISEFIPNAEFRKIADLNGEENDKSGSVLIITYNAFSNENKFSNVQKWLGEQYDGLMIFDEAHYAKSAEASQNASMVGRNIVKLQEKNPMARVVYSTATSASEPYQLLYMTRLGIWGKSTAFEDMNTLKRELDKGGVKFMELLTMELKMKGVFLSRQISYKNVVLRVEESSLSPESAVVYNRCAQLLTLFFEYLKEQRRQKAEESINENCSSTVMHGMGVYYAMGLQITANLLLSGKLEKAAHITTKALEEGKSIVIGIQHTGQSQFQNFRTERWNQNMPYSFAAFSLRNGFVSAGIKVGCPKLYYSDGTVGKIGNWEDADEETADQLYRKMKGVKAGEDAGLVYESEDDEDFENEYEETEEEKEKDNDEYNGDQQENKKMKLDDNWSTALKCNVPEYCTFRYLTDDQRKSDLTWSYQETSNNLTAENLARMYHELYPFLPINPLDELRERLKSCKVSEITGGKSEKYILEDNDDGDEKWEVMKKPSQEIAMQEFMNQKTRVCIISSAGSVGVSLHADVRKPNKQPRLHITLQYAWSPDKVLQQLGRTHRTNQIMPPEYCLINSNVPAERRYISIIEKRLKQIGAITQAQAMASKAMFEGVSDVLCTPIGIKALRDFMNLAKKNTMLWHYMRLADIKPPSVHHNSRSSEKATLRCYNRMALLPIDFQKVFFEGILDCITSLRISKNQLDCWSPIVEFPSCNASICCKALFALDLGNEAFCEVYTFLQSRLLSWENATRKINVCHGGDSARYYVIEDRRAMIAVTQDDGKAFAFVPYCRAPISITEDQLSGWTHTQYIPNCRKVWNQMLKLLEENPGCIHQVDKSSCRVNCYVNWGVQEFTVISGYTSLLWRDILDICDAEEGLKVQVAKVAYPTKKGIRKLVGILLEKEFQPKVVNMLLSKYPKRV